jgi:hypothetical protein
MTSRQPLHLAEAVVTKVDSLVTRKELLRRCVLAGAVAWLGQPPIPSSFVARWLVATTFQSAVARWHVDVNSINSTATVTIVHEGRARSCGMDYRQHCRMNAILFIRAQRCHHAARLRPGVVGRVMEASHEGESFRSLLLRHRGRTGLPGPRHDEA